MKTENSSSHSYVFDYNILFLTSVWTAEWYTFTKWTLLLVLTYTFPNYVYEPFMEAVHSFMVPDNYEWNNYKVK
jgi:hypothetical protein